MTGEEWTRYLASLATDLQTLAANIMRRVTRLLNKERIAILDDIQRMERGQARNADRINEVEQHQYRYVAQQDRLEERVQEVETKVQALAEALARLQAGPDGDG